MFQPTGVVLRSSLSDRPGTLMTQLPPPADLHTKLIAQLSRYGERYPTERDVVERFLTFIHTHHDCCERTQQAGHITGSCWIVSHDREQVLLTHHRKLNRWLQLGGHADGERDILTVATREAIEESGITTLRALSSEIFDLDIHPIPARGDEPAHLHFDVRYLFQGDATIDPVVSAESHAVAWIPLAALTAYSAEESIHRMARKSTKL